MVEEVPKRSALLLQIIKSDKGFLFYPVEGPHVNAVWYATQHPKKPEFFVVKKIEKGYTIITKELKYDALGVKNLCELFILLLVNPQEIYTMLTGEKINVDEINVFNTSVKFKFGFRSCSFFDKVMIYN